MTAVAVEGAGSFKPFARAAAPAAYNAFSAGVVDLAAVLLAVVLVVVVVVVVVVLVVVVAVAVVVGVMVGGNDGAITFGSPGRG